MDTQTIIDFIKNLSNENIQLKNKIIELEKHNQLLNDNLSGLTKVSFIGNIDKQLN